MKFFDRLSNGWQLAKTSLAIIEEEKSLLLFPVLSTLALIMVCATFFGGGYFIFCDQLLAASETAETGSAVSPFAYVLAFLYYFVTYFVIIFFNSALVHCAVQVLNGEETSLSEGLEFATSKLDKILAWTSIAATVGLVLKVLQSNEKIGQIAAAIIGAGWSILTFFVVPVMLYEDKDVFGSIKRSGGIMREKWGESLGANFGFGFINFIAILLIGVLAFVLAQINIVLAIVVALGSLLLLGTVMSAAQTVFLAAIYQHVHNRPTGNFDETVLDDAFMTK
ncbi:MAG: DUF6159 family protein [Saprospiraceae bacterium]